jgi:hypothetical protein
VNEYNKHLRDLERQVADLRHTVIDLAPERFRDLLQVCNHSISSRRDCADWKREAIAAIVEQTEPEPRLSMLDERSACPLCGSYGITCRSGFALPEGLRRHLVGDRKARPCKVIQAAFNLVRDQHASQFEIAEQAEREEKERRLRSLPTVLIDPAKEPLTLFESESRWERLRSPEELVQADELLRKIGFVIEKENNVTAYKFMQGATIMVMANPREQGKVSFRIFKRSGKHRWKRISSRRQDDFVLHDKRGGWLIKFRTLMLEQLDQHLQLEKRRSSEPVDSSDPIDGP